MIMWPPLRMFLLYTKWYADQIWSYLWACSTWTADGASEWSYWSDWEMWLRQYFEPEKPDSKEQSTHRERSSSVSGLSVACCWIHLESSQLLLLVSSLDLLYDLNCWQKLSKNLYGGLLTIYLAHIPSPASLHKHINMICFVNLWKPHFC